MMQKRGIVVCLIVSVLLISCVSAFSFSEFFDNLFGGKITGHTVNGGCPSNLVAYYNFNGNALDSSGNGNDGSMSGGVSSVSGKIGNAYSFDGSDGSYVTVTNSASLSFNEGITVSFWAKPNTLPNGYIGIVEKAVYPGIWEGWTIGTHGSKVYFSPDNCGPEAGSISVGQWYHIVMTVDSSGVTKGYINGAFVGSTTNDQCGGRLTGGNIGGTSVDLVIGRESDFSNRAFNGQVDELAIYDSALSASEVSELYNSGNGKDVCSAVVPLSCTESWTCSNWSACSSGMQTRNCTDANSCGTTASRPALTQNCSVVSTATCTDRIINQDETGVDCGGSICPACVPVCTDSDGGLNYNVRGNISFGVEHEEDVCLKDTSLEFGISDPHLIEYYCVGDESTFQGFHKNITICSNGCSNGVCNSAPSNAVCGNAVVDAGEQCDIGTGNNGACPSFCSYSCTINNCGVATAFVFQNLGDEEIIIKDLALKTSVEDISLVYGNADEFTGLGESSVEQLRIGSTSITFNGNTDKYFVASNVGSKESYLMRATSFVTESGVNMVTIQYRKDFSWVDAKKDAQSGDTVSIGSVGLKLGAIDKIGKSVEVNKNVPDIAFDKIFDSNGNYIDLSEISVPASEILLSVMDSDGLTTNKYRFYWNLGEPKVQKLTSVPPTTCPGCMYNGTCMPVGYRFNDDKGTASFCDIFGVTPQKVNFGSVASCQNNFECETNLCSEGQCVSVSGFRATLINILCRVTTIFQGEEAYLQCVDENINGVVPVCGDGAINGQEQCDGSDLNGQTCESLALGSSSGILSCTSNCMFNSSRCNSGVDNCDGVTCPTGEVCNASSGACIPIPLDLCAGASCSPGQTCNPNTGACEENQGTVSITGTTATFSSAFLDDSYVDATITAGSYSGNMTAILSARSAVVNPAVSGTISGASFSVSRSSGRVCTASSVDADCGHLWVGIPEDNQDCEHPSCVGGRCTVVIEPSYVSCNLLDGRQGVCNNGVCSLRCQFGSECAYLLSGVAPPEDAFCKAPACDVNTGRCSLQQLGFETICNLADGTPARCMNGVCTRGICTYSTREADCDYLLDSVTNGDDLACVEPMCDSTNKCDLHYLTHSQSIPHECTVTTASGIESGRCANGICVAVPSDCSPRCVLTHLDCGYLDPECGKSCFGKCPTGEECSLSGDIYRCVPDTQSCDTTCGSPVELSCGVTNCAGTSVVESCPTQSCPSGYTCDLTGQYGVDPISNARYALYGCLPDGGTGDSGGDGSGGDTSGDSPWYCFDMFC